MLCCRLGGDVRLDRGMEEPVPLEVNQYRFWYAWRQEQERGMRATKRTMHKSAMQGRDSEVNVTRLEGDG